MKKILVVCAHPDDETLGLGGTIVKHSQNGDQVFVVIFADGESARSNSKKNIVMRKNQAKKVATILGIEKIKFLDYRDQTLDTISSLVLAKKLEKIIEEYNPDTIYTHFWGDVNQDHKKIFDITLIAARPTPNSNIQRLICYETPSSTEWGNASFKPNLFVEITPFLKKKIAAVEIYKNEIHEYPHPRSDKSIVTRSNFWGSSIGVMNAEAFIVLRDIEKI
ncbi:Diacetylchitobiose deacetylase [Candidatus Nitrosomarinus catalina]|uniref:Diacetylchitobiose deacetylase n=1 Tax=Candidatus Nitrosomarinus catalinensis TaxID=1898749 RepID=A0A2Z2HHV3_9ARCH|nr:PIG-L deacetylase family protein [Candidatus Nitrosomarinus catalina]ARS63777.1 Diacetylchitobiose deacetylase [Candidatus Nitrosomarinus catalina]